MQVDQVRQMASTPAGMAQLVAERDRRAQAFAEEQAAAAAHHQKRLAELAATGRPVRADFTDPLTGVANLAAEDAAWVSGGGLERIYRLEFSLHPEVKSMSASALREFVESGRAAAWQAGERAKLPASGGDPFAAPAPRIANATPAATGAAAPALPQGAPSAASASVQGMANELLATVETQQNTPLVVPRAADTIDTLLQIDPDADTQARGSRG